MLILPLNNGAASSVVAWGYNGYGQATVPTNLPNVASIAAGRFHSLALGQQGQVYAWGQDDYQQTNVPTGLSNVVAIEAGETFSVALKSDGEVVAWGTNNSGQCNVPTNLANAVAIDAGARHALALQHDGTVMAWGSNSSGQTNIPTGLAGVVAIAAGGFHCMALRSNGTVVAWGFNGYGETNIPAGLSDVIGISAGNHHSMALRANGTVRAWGYNGYGQTNVPTGLSGVVAIAAGDSHSLALKSDGTVVGWGANFDGQTNTPSGLTNVFAIAAGMHSLALTADVAPTFAISPSDQIAPTNTDVTFYSRALGRLPLRYQWYRNGLPIADAAGPSYTVTTVAVSDTGSYHVIASNAFGVATSSVAVLALLLPPTITAQPQSRVVLAGSDTAFSVAAAAGTAPLSYQWQKNNANLAGATNPSLTLTSVQLTNAGDYRVVITNIVGSVTSSVANLDVRLLLASATGQVLSASNYVFVGQAVIDLDSTFAGGSIFYTLDGSTPSFLSAFYSGPITLEWSATVRAITYSADFSQSWEAPPIHFTIIPIYALNLISPGGGAVTADPPAGPYVSNTIVTLTPQPSNGWTFLEWRGDASGTNPTVALTMNREKTVQAIFGTTLGTTVAGNGSVAVYPALALYPYGTIARLTAIPQSGNYFGVWGNAGSGNTNPLYFAVTGANPGISSLFAALGANQHALTVIPDGFGRVTISPRANVYATGSSVSLNATPDPAQEFLGWSGDATSTVNPLPISMNASRTITATFTRKPALSVSPLLDGFFEDGFRFTLHGEFGRALQIEASTNLVNWTQLTLLTNEFGTIQFTDKSATNRPHQFYRAVSY